MKPFKKIASRAIPLPRDNVDTDVIFPGKYLSTVARTGLGEFAFESLRFNDDGIADPECVLNQPDYEEAEILLTGHNFGCGSSREHAVWAIDDLGIRCIIAKSFGDTFYFNCLANGLLAIVLDGSALDRLFESAPKGKILVDLEKQTVRAPDGEENSFEIDEFNKKNLLEGLDAIDLTLQDQEHISAFEKRQKNELPWLYEAPGGGSGAGS